MKISMRKELTLLLILITFSTILISSCSENKLIVDLYGDLKVSGNQIVNNNNEPIALHGMSLFWSQIKPKYYNYECIKWLRDDWNCTVIRAAMGIEMADSIDGYLVNKEEELKKILTVIDAAIDLGLYVIVDWHDHDAHNNIEEAKIFFKMIAEKYGDKPNIIYEIYNEPMQISWQNDVKPYSEEIIKTIRKIDPDNLIIVGTTTWSQDVDIASLDPLNFNNIVYSLHFYASSHNQDLRNKAKKALNNGAALFVSEFGTTEYTGDGFIDTLEVKAWFDFMSENKISWCNWSIGDKDETSAALKPGANSSGGWKDSDINRSGLIVKKKIKELNINLFDTKL